MRRKIFALFVSALLMLTLITTAFAAEFDPEKKGSVSVTLLEQYDKTPLAGAELSLYYVATVGVKTNGNLTYNYTEAFADCGVAIDDPDLASRLGAFASQNNVESVKLVTDEKGSATIRDVELGLYLICQTDDIEGYAPIAPFLASVPVKTADGYEYDVTASPKTEVARLTSVTIKKIWNTDASASAADSVTVQLLHGENVIETVILSEKNGWKVTFEDMPESDAYSIKEVDVPKGFTATYKQEGYVFTVTNTSTLIQTGQLIWPIPVFAIGGMALILLGIVLLKKKRKTNA